MPARGSSTRAPAERARRARPRASSSRAAPLTPVPRSATARAGLRPRARPGTIGAGEQLVQDRHADDEAALHLRRDQRVRRVDHLRRQLDAAVHRAGVHQELPRAEPARVDLVASGVLAKRGHEALPHPLALHPQRVDDVGLADPVERVGDLAAERLEPARDQGRGTAHRHPRAHDREREHARARDATVEDVADDPDPAAVERVEPAPKRVDVEQGLARVLVLAVARVDHRGVGPARDQVRGAGVRGANHDRLRVVGAQRRDRVLQRLALVDRRARRLDRDHVRGESLRRKLERGAGPGARLVEEVHDRPPAERRHLLDVAPAHLGEALGALEDALDVGALEMLDRQQVLHSVPAPRRC